MSDMWSHEFNEIEHISTVHAVYGSQHLQKEVAEKGETDQQKSANTLKAEDQVPSHLSAERYSSNNCVTLVVQQFLVFRLNKILAICIPHQGPPPKFIGTIV